MKFFPKTVGGVSIYVFAVFVMVTVLFAQQYGWFDASKYIAKK
jgi:hypothetical protein